MKKSWRLLPKILSGEKTIESRWYKNKIKPWDKINKGDTVYFKNSGEPITSKADVVNVLQYSALSPVKVRRILDKYGHRDGIENQNLGFYYNLFKNKNYGLLIFISNPVKIRRPFNIRKDGFGSMSAWITIDRISKIKIK